MCAMVFSLSLDGIVAADIFEHRLGPRAPGFPNSGTVGEVGE